MLTLKDQRLLLLKNSGGFRRLIKKDHTHGHVYCQPFLFFSDWNSQSQPFNRRSAIELLFV